MMMKLWRRLGVDRLLRQAWNKGTVLCGASAGSICWFASGHSDSLSFYNPKRWKYINVRGLGFLKGIHCPHFNGHTLHLPRKKHFERMMQKIGGMGIAIDNDCAIAFIDNGFRVLPSKKSAGAYRVYKHKRKVVTERIPPSSTPTGVRRSQNLYRRTPVGDAAISTKSSLSSPYSHS
jgi:dipeptidase E